VRIATWNVNSIRARIDRVLALLERHDLDVLAVQETKCRDDQFPYLAFEGTGYAVAHAGLNQWNGVAILSRVGLDDIQVGFEGMPGWGDPVAAETRAISALCGGVRVWSLYVPNGRGLGDPHMDYKLDWLERLRQAGAGWLVQADPQAQIALMGDWNIAPQDEDVWSMAYYEDKSHVSPPERAAFAGVLDAGYVDMVRPHVPAGAFTYWDYTQLRFPKKQGMRIDFALGSPALAQRITGASIDREERKGKGASDHAPVIIDLA